MEIREPWITRCPELMDSVSQSQADWRADKIRGVVAQTVMDDERRGGK